MNTAPAVLYAQFMNYLSEYGKEYHKKCGMVKATTVEAMPLLFLRILFVGRP